MYVYTTFTQTLARRKELAPLESPLRRQLQVNVLTSGSTTTCQAKFTLLSTEVTIIIIIIITITVTIVVVVVVLVAIIAGRSLTLNRRKVRARSKMIIFASSCVSLVSFNQCWNVRQPTNVTSSYPVRKLDSIFRCQTLAGNASFRCEEGGVR